MGRELTQSVCKWNQYADSASGIPENTGQLYLTTYALFCFRGTASNTAT